MKLFVFEHCPYCVRAMMIVGYKKLDVPFEVLQNHDVDSRIRMVGANMVPILQKPDGSFMGESLDIVAYLDGLDGNPLLEPPRHESAIKAWLDEAGYFSARLLHPRNVKLGLKEYGSAEAIAWYTDKKSAAIGMSFDEAMAATPTWLAGLNATFAALEFVPLPSERGNRLSLDDILLYPPLRNLTAVKGVQFGARLERYIAEVTALTGIRLFGDLAI
ncbi:glutaredoxin 2 [Shewanella sp. JM162201]|uniref:Glutaredoxin 2 n=1 Tax=Shewanella jiangmenensis TaxID=2837387 RepID=A0ABS5V2J7_9GAMM|nr:glutaredoxin 2 [Shewanella jiangmenensis]MBT1444670.1 glutaredoxin 2 [Shewanella jiangmenensis]